MNFHTTCNEHDLNTDFSDFLFDSNPETFEENDVSEFDSMIDDDFGKVPETKKTVIYQKYFWSLVFIFAIVIITISFFLVSLSLIGSYIFCIITIFMFFVSFFISYVMSPVYLSLNHDWTNFVFAVLQVFLSSPLVVFFLFFFVHLIRKLGDLLDSIGKIFTYSISFNKDDPEKVRNSKIELFATISYTILVIIYAILAIYTTFLQRGLTLLHGCFFIIPSLCQLLILLFPQYRHFFIILFQKRTYKNVDQNNHISNFSCDLCCIDCAERWDAKSDGEDEKIDEMTQTFINDKGQISLQIGYSKYAYKKNEMTVFTSPKNQNHNEIPRFDKKMSTLFSFFRRAIFIREFVEIYNVGKQLFDYQFRHQKQRVLLWIFTILNIFLISFDIYRAINDPNISFRITTFFRFLLLPVFSYYHILVPFMISIKDKTLRICNLIAFCVTVIIFIGIIIISFIASYYKHTYRIHGYQYHPKNESIQYYNEILLSHPLCLYEQYGVNAIEAFSYAVAVYDVIDNPELFHEEMKTFFGSNYTDFIDIEVYNITNDIPFVIYRNHKINTTILGFRGFNSAQEIAFYVQTVAEHYIVPFFTGLIPFVDIITKYFLEVPIMLARIFGRNMFDPTNPVITYVSRVIDICIENGIDIEKRVLFAGIGTGATLGKLASISRKKYSISFLNLPIWNDYFSSIFDLNPDDMGLITNFYIFNATFALPEPQLATNIGIYSTPFPSSISPDVCESNICSSKQKSEETYPTLCLIAGMCGYNAQYNDYCRAALQSSDDLDIINAYVLGLDGNQVTNYSESIQ